MEKISESMACPLLEHRSFIIQPDKRGDCTLLHAVTNCVALLIGLATLSSPFAVARGGLASIVINFVLAVVFYYCTTLLVHCMEAHPDLINYQDVCTKAYGKRGRALASMLLIADIFSALVSYCISLTDNLVSIFPSTAIGFWGIRGRYFLTFVASLALLPTVWIRSFKSLSLLSASSTISFLLVFLALIWLATFNNIGTRETIPLFRWDGLPVASGIFLFTYGSNIIVPSVRNSMIDRSKFNKVLALSFAIAALFYSGIGVLGASMFGEETQSQITLNMPSQFMASKVAIWANIITPLTKFSLLLRPVACELESLLPWSNDSKRHMVAALSLRSMLLVAIVMISLTVPFFAYVISFVGSSLDVVICLIMPCWFYYKIFRNSITKWEITGFVALSLGAAVVGAVGTVYSVIGIGDTTSTNLLPFWQSA